MTTTTMKPYSQLDEITNEVRARAEQTEQDRRVPHETVAKLRSAGFFRQVQPKAFGGDEANFATLAQNIMQLAAACPSTGWVCGLLAAHQWLAAHFPEEAQQDVWGADPGALICGSYAPTGSAKAERNGYRLSGRWQFASGCDNAEWAVCAAFLPDGPPAFFLVPNADYSIVDDWHTVGLAGTGSNTLELSEAFVPEHRILPFVGLMSGDTPGAKLYSANPDFKMPMQCNLPSCLAAVGIGAAAGAIEEFLALVGSRETRGAIAGAGSRMAEFSTVQLRVAEAVAGVDAAGEILLRDLRRRVGTVREGKSVSVSDRISSRSGQAFAVSLALRAVEGLNMSTGGRGLAHDNPVQRAWRDVHAVSRHISLNWDAVGTMCGQHALGLEPRGQY